MNINTTRELVESAKGPNLNTISINEFSMTFSERISRSNGSFIHLN